MDSRFYPGYSPRTTKEIVTMNTPEKADAVSTPPSEIMANYKKIVTAGQRGLNLGCGGQTISGWLNIDEDLPHHVDIIWNLREGLPFIPTSSFDVVYSEHFLEHIDRKSALNLMRECTRSLVPGGVVRIAMPNLDDLLRAYRDGDKHPDVNESFSEEFGGAFQTRGELFNIAMRAWGHTYIYNVEDAILLLKAAGLENVKSVEHLQSEHPLLAGRETRPPYQSGLIVEGTKPAATSILASITGKAGQLFRSLGS
jgi:predicted SAM-dependent methyltransferase